MKLKGLLKSFFILGLTLSPIFFVNAQEVVNNSVLLVDVPDSFVVGSYSYDIDSRVNISTDGVGDFLDWVTYPTYNQFHNIFGWINNKLYYVSYDINEGRGYLQGQQGFINSFCATTDISQLCTDFNVSADQFYYMRKNITKLAVGTFYWSSLQGSDGDLPFGLCFYNALDSYYYCAYSSWVQGAYNTSSLVDSLGFSSTGDIIDYSWGSSPISSSTTYYYSTGSCPTVGQLKASSNLTPAVCYGGYGPNVMYGDQVAFVGGSGMSIFDVYSDYLTSFSDPSMNIQTFYDTYWAYYQNIAHDSRPFEGLKKSYLGLQFARQTFGNTRGINGSYMILNYCYYIVNNTPDSQSTCVGSNVSTQYPGITFTNQDNQDIVDAINDDYNVHYPSSGSIFLDPSQGLGGGGFSWGDDQCDGIPCLFEKFYQMFTSSRVNNVDFSQGGQGILPGYIALAFVIVVLFYVFKR